MHKFNLLVAMGLAVLAFSISALAEPENPAGFHDDSELGLVLTGGNTKANTINLKQINTNGWGRNFLKLDGAYLDTTANGLESARSWDFGLRYERDLLGGFGTFLGQNVESDIFAGYAQRYNSDIGLAYKILMEKPTTWLAEAGYRYTVENRFYVGQVNTSFARLYTEIKEDVEKTMSVKLWVEYLPDLSSANDYRLNTELSLTAILNDVFSIKTAYLVKYINQPLVPGNLPTDTIFTTALVAKF